MRMPPRRLRAFAFVFGVAMLSFSGWASADPPSRVARLGYLSGQVSFSPAGESDWIQATINRPLTTGDRLWADAGARSEIQIGGAMVRMNAGTSVSVLNLDDQITQLQLTQGTLHVRVRRVESDQVFEVDTPNLAFTLRQPGEYRIDVDPDRDETTIVMRKGQGQAYGDNASYVIDAQQPYRFTGTDLREYEAIGAPRPDDFDRWASDRDRRYDSSVSARYVSPDVVGYQDLDSHGSWRIDASYGNVWTPNRVAAGWAPYSDGHWAWVDPWGWTWIDDAPWGYAVSHYGRWANFSGTWGWVPGPVRTRAYYAPALVVFVGGNNFQLTISSGNVGGVAWFPLGPREVYRPSYPVSRGYFENVNQTNTVINTTIINNTYNNLNVTNVVYANRQVTGAVIAVPTAAFVQSQPVSKVALRASKELIAGAPVAIAPPLAPTEKSVRGAAAQRDKPPARAFERPVVALTAPPAAHVGFAAQQPQLAAKPGQPLDEGARKDLKRAAAAPAPVVKVVTAPPQAPQALREAPAVAPPQQRGKSDQPGKAEPRGKAAALPAAAAREATPQASPAPAPVVRAPAAPAPEPAPQRGKPDAQGKAEPRGRPAAPSAAEPQAPTPQAQPAPAPVARTPAPPAAEPAPQRGRSDPQGKAEPRAQPVVPATATPKEPARKGEPASAPAARKASDKKASDKKASDAEDSDGNNRKQKP